MQYDLEPGNFVVNPSQKSWGIGQVQSIIKNKATVNFENGVESMLSEIKNWKDAPLWTAKTIKIATKSWFKYMRKIK